MKITTAKIGYDQERTNRLMAEQRIYNERMGEIDEKLKAVKEAENKLDSMRQTRSTEIQQLHEKYTKLIDEAEKRAEFTKITTQFKRITILK